mgnify:FL=1
MKKQSGLLRRLTALALALCMLAALTAEIFAADTVASGYCGSEGDGKNLTWTLDSEGVLTISGLGKMKDYENDNKNRAPWYSSRKSLKKLVLKSGITSIGDYAFFDCSNLTGDLKIPSNVHSIGENAFGYCSGFNGSLTIENGVVEIKKYAFYHCKGFTGSLKIPNSVTYIGVYAFYDCAGFTGDLIIGDGVTTIERGAFSGCYRFKGTLKIGNSVTSIGEGAFTSCRGFTGSLIIPDSVTSIGQQAFSFCAGLNGSLIIGNGVTKIQSWAFENCTGIKKVIIGSGVTSVSNESFIRCNSVSGFYLRGNAPTVYLNVTGVEGPFLHGVPLYYIPGTTGWTDNSAYDAAKETWNGYPLRTWNGNTIPEKADTILSKGWYSIQVVDEAGAPISGATVTRQSDTASTDNNGRASINLSASNDVVIRVSKTGYLDWTNENVDWQNGEIVVLYPEGTGNLKLKAAKYGSRNLVTQTKIFSLQNGNDSIWWDGSSNPFNLTCIAMKPEDAKSYALYQGSQKIVESSTGVFEKIDVSKFTEGGGCFVRVTDADGKFADTNINLQFARNSVNENTEIMLKSSALSLKISDDIPYLGGTTLKFDLPLQAPVVFSCTEDKIQLGVNLKLNDKESKEKQTKEYIEKIKELQKIGKLKNNKWPLKRNVTQLKKYVQKNNKADFFKDKMDFTFCGYLEGDVGSKTISGYFLIIGESKLINIEHNFMMWIVPVTFQTNLNFYFEAGGGGSYCFDTKMWDLNIVFNPTFTLEGFIGAGCSKFVGLGIYGCAELETKINIIGTNSGLQSADLTGELAIKGYIGWVEAKRVFAHQTWHLYTANSVKSHSLRSGAAWDAAPEASAYAPSDLSYLAEESDWAPAAVRTYAARAAQARTEYHPLLENTYRNAQPVMVSDGSALYAAFVRANETTGKRYVALTKFDGTSWSAPAAVDASAILDDAPQLCTDAAGNLWLAYARTTQEPGDSLVAYAQHQTIVVGTVNKDTLAFTAQKTYQSDNYMYMHLPTLSCVNGTPVLAWAESAVTSEESVVNPTASAVYTAEYCGGAWLDARKAADAAAVSSLCIGAQNGTPAVAYTADGKLHCGSRLLAENVTGRAVYGRLPGTTADSFIWNADGALHDEAGNTVPVEGLGRDFVIVGDSIYFNQSNGASANLAALHYDAVNDHWSAPILLIGDEQYLENLNAAELNGKTYALGMHTTVTITADDVDDTKDLVWTQILPVSDLKLSDVSFDADALVPGETLPVTFTVTNSGDHTVSSLTLTADGVSTAQDCQLLPGESGEFTVNITCPSEKQIVTFEVQEPGQDDYTPEDNTAACTVGSADAEVELALLQIGSRKFLQAVVVNRGLEPASGSVLFTGPDGQTLAERTFQNLTYGGTVIAEYEPDSFAALYGEDVTATVRLQQDEPNMLNNTDSVPVLLTSTEILSAQRTGTAVTAEIACMQDGARAICAFYAADGRLLSTSIQPLESGKINSLTFQIDSNAAQAKLFVLDAKNAPAAPARSIPLNS